MSWCSWIGSGHELRDSCGAGGRYFWHHGQQPFVRQIHGGQPTWQFRMHRSAVSSTHRFFRAAPSDEFLYVEFAMAPYAIIAVSGKAWGRSTGEKQVARPLERGVR
mmetsp:Transcript_146700/g.365815  ORF Transcript_146700/g.365815 Transcript_146700/m.365815 type:complete len:106 (+) Transcript_146700:316-633(+)